MPKNSEVEIKFRVTDARRLERSLTDAGFQLKTPPTHEMNSLYDRAGNPLRRQGAILRLRKYGERWRLTHKAKGKAGRYKTREEHETAVENGPELDAILRALGYVPSLCLRKVPLRMERWQGRSCGGPHAHRGCRRNRGRAALDRPHRSRARRRLSATTSPSRTANFFWSGRKQPEVRRLT